MYKNVRHTLDFSQRPQFSAGTLQCSAGSLQCSEGTLQCSEGTLQCSAGTLQSEVQNASNIINLLYTLYE